MLELRYDTIAVRKGPVRGSLGAFLRACTQWHGRARIAEIRKPPAAIAGTGPGRPTRH